MTENSVSTDQRSAATTVANEDVVSYNEVAASGYQSQIGAQSVTEYFQQKIYALNNSAITPTIDSLKKELDEHRKCVHEDISSIKSTATHFFPEMDPSLNGHFVNFSNTIATNYRETIGVVNNGHLRCSGVVTLVSVKQPRIGAFIIPAPEGSITEATKDEIIDCALNHYPIARVIRITKEGLLCRLS